MVRFDSPAAALKHESADDRGLSAITANVFRGAKYFFTSVHSRFHCSPLPHSLANSQTFLCVVTLSMMYPVILVAALTTAALAIPHGNRSVPANRQWVLSPCAKEHNKKINL